MHLCFVESGYPHPHGGGGAGTYVQLVGRELVRQGHKVTVVAAHCTQCSTATDDQGVQVFRPQLRGKLHWYASRVPGIRVFALALRGLENGWLLYRFLERLHQQNPFDLVEFTEGGDLWHGLRAPFPFVTHLHGSRYTSLHKAGKPVGHSDWYHRYLELRFIDRAAWVVSPSQAMLDVVQKEAGKSFRRTSVIPYPLDPALLKQPSEVTQPGSGNPIVLFAARNDPVKGADVLLEAIPTVRRQFPGVEFRLFGYQPQINEALPDGVACRPFVPKSELLAQYHQADLVVVPSRWDNSPNTVYEAMAAGKAVVASRVGGIPELVSDGESGVLVASGDSRNLAQAIVDLLSDERQRMGMGAVGQRRIQEIAGLESNVQRRLQIYTDLIR